MDILDRITNKPALEALFAAEAATDVSRDVNRVQMRKVLQEGIIGHDAIIDEVVDQVWAVFQMSERTSAVGVFMFAGPPSTGKTEFGKMISKALYGDNAYLMIKMENFSSEHSASTLGGSSPGQAGSTVPSGLVAHLIAKPASVIILDEFEKAHPKIQRMFLGAWQEGKYTDMTTGKSVRTNDTIFVVTTNAAQDELAPLAATFRGSPEDLSEQCKLVLAHTFEDSLLSRVNYVFPLPPLKGIDLAALFGKMCVDLLRKYKIELVNMTHKTLFNYVQEATRRGIDPRNMERRMLKDVRDQAIHLRDSGHRRVVIEERDGQVFVEPYREPLAKAPAATAKAAPAGKAKAR